MINYAEYILRSYFMATDWNPDAQYSNLNRASAAILDFAPPSALSISLSSCPTQSFASSCSLSILPSLTGSLAYLASSTDLPRQKPTLHSLVHNFNISALPKVPTSTHNHYLLYGQLHLPSSRLHSLYTRRLSPHSQLLVSSISHPRPPTRDEPSEMYITYQKDKGEYASELAYSVADGMASASSLFHFGLIDKGVESSHSPSTPHTARIDEEPDDDGSGGLKGHFSLGGEIYASALEKSAGVSTGLRFQTLPDTHSPPTVLVALLSPITGYLSGTYAATVARGLSLASRFEFNLFSYESVTTLGAEWAIHRSEEGEREQERNDDDTYWDENSQELKLKPNAVNSIPLSASTAIDEKDPIQGYVKARITTEKSVALQYAGRLKSLLISLGLVADLSNPHKPVQSIGLELQYLSPGNEPE
ncbi:hypothetical protein E3P81_03462 [Wallemia ichthyophaga]|nr:hypothetical protein E3P97_03499 [Wallemia ichthyophaga]TIB44537.1 hypothetical protein E3P82_03467 [Wallemia ichthyophaga]TIB46964.1 hypothetical protein E3P81_03462 [Wallemia ichthyophaga]TIB49828.1 hypothetical protein E3P80_03471 [Wallemia ichthyophaga]TIB56582.1 hypothetical protein E3P79_03464 [Wallemia ichthyophaga]